MMVTTRGARGRGRGRRGGDRALLFAVVTLLAIIVGSLPVAQAGAAVGGQNASPDEQVCQWDDKEGKEKCSQQQSQEEEAEEEEEEEEAEDKEEEEEEGAPEEWGELFDTDVDQMNEYKERFGEFMSLPKEGEEWDVWKHGTKNDIYSELGCEAHFESNSYEKTDYTESWETFNKIYNEVIASTQGDEKLQQESTIPDKFEKNGFQFPIEIKFHPDKGRGVYSKGDIPKGSLLYISTNNGAFFNGQTYRNFLRALPSNLACDVLIWAFVRWVSLASNENYEHMVCVDLDEGSFVNTANEDDYESSFNMALGNDDGKLLVDMDDKEEMELWYGCKMKFYAFQDIKAGDEILADYDNFAETHGWRYLGLGLW